MKTADHFENPVLKYLSEARPIKHRELAPQTPIRHLYDYNLASPPPVSGPLPPCPAGQHSAPAAPLHGATFLADLFEQDQLVYSRAGCPLDRDNNTVGMALFRGSRI
jgi:hypothetical protein